MLEVNDSRVLRFPYRGAPQTVDVMRRAVLESQDHIVVRRLAEEICSGIDSKDYLSEYLAIYNFVLTHTRYMRDPRTVELVRAPYLVCEEILRGRTPCLDCDDQGTLIAALILSVGGRCSFVTAAFKRLYYQGRLQYSHVFDIAQEPLTGQMIVLDPVAAEKTRSMLNRIVASKVWPIA